MAALLEKDTVYRIKVKEDPKEPEVMRLEFTRDELDHLVKVLKRAGSDDQEELAFSERAALSVWHDRFARLRKASA